MNNNYNHQNFNCEFAPEIVDFLYDELKDGRRKAFELHLDRCSDCAGEVRDFSEIKFSIQGWKSSEFDKISTPQIIIPYEKSGFRQVETENSLSIIQTLRSYFSLSPVFSGAAAVLIAAFLLAAGLFLMNGKEKDLLAENNANLKPNQTSLPMSAEITDNAGEPKVEKTKIESNVKTSEIKNDKTEPDKIIRVEIENKSTLTRKAQNNKISEKRITATTAVVSGNAKTPGKNTQVKNKPRLNELPEDDEDKSLRLADMFAELETR